IATGALIPGDICGRIRTRFSGVRREACVEVAPGAGRRSPSDAVGRSAGQEAEQRAGELLRRLLGHVMAAVDPPAAEVGGPRAPDRERVAVEVLEVVLDRPEEERRAGDPPARGPVGLVVRAV